MHRAVLAVVATAALGGPVTGQSGKPPARIHGTVQDTRGEPVQGVRIEIRGLDQAATTDGRGSFSLDAIAPGRYWIMVRGPGFDPQRRAATLDPGEDRALDFALNPVPVRSGLRKAVEHDSLDRDFQARTRTHLEGYFLTRDDIVRSRQPFLGEVLAHYMIPVVPRSGFRFTSNDCAPWESWIVRRSPRLGSDTQPYPFVSVNGSRPFRSRALYEFDPLDVEAVEVYRGSASFFGFLPSETRCGLVIVWTR